MAAPVPAASDILSSIRTSSKALRTASKIQIDEDKARQFWLDLKEEDWTKDSGGARHGIRLPLRFDTDVEELNIIATLSLLNFLSGYREPLKRLTTRGAWNSILSLVLSAHLSSTSPSSSGLSASGFQSATPATLASLMQIKTHTEKPHETMGPAVMVGVKDDEAWDILELVAGVLKETGAILQREGKRDLGHWVRDALLETLGDTGELLKKIVSTFPAFNDSALVDGEPVYIYKKALFLLNAISDRWTGEKPAFPLPSRQEPLPIFADNVIPTMLAHFSVLNLSTSTDPSLSSSNAASTPLSASSAFRLRAAAIDCCSTMVAVAHSLGATEERKPWLKEVTEVDLDGYLWSVAKETQEGVNLREVQRFSEKGTVYY